MRAPRKFGLKLLLFLLAGAILNVAVAWACAIWSYPGEAEQVTTDLPMIVGSTLDEKVLGIQRTYYRREGFGVRIVRVVDENYLGFIAHSTYIGSDDSFAVVLSGWPCLGLNSRIALKEDGTYDTRYLLRWRSPNANLTQGMNLREECIELPLAPIWPGFAINTIVYAAILYALFAVPGTVRQRVRIKRGQCASCGYSRRESVSDKCSECGATIRRATR